MPLFDLQVMTLRCGATQSCSRGEASTKSLLWLKTMRAWSRDAAAAYTSGEYSGVPISP